MSQERFTPGPWITNETPASPKAHAVWRNVDDERDVFICCLRNQYGADCQADDTHANLKLIAAAPELYAALKEWLDFEERSLVMPDESDVSANPRGKALIDRSLAALAKARGEA